MSVCAWAQQPNIKANRLIHEKSPYLLQHAYNPVDWYSWQQEAFDKAKKEDKPIFLSIGYSTCHWCHVMEEESYSDLRIAKILNDNFIAIKVDREERPDIDSIYMQAVEAMTGSGGWPLNVFLTPDLKPFYGGTYFPPTSRWGQPGLDTVLIEIAQKWKTQKGSILRQAMDLKSGRTSTEGIPMTASSFSPMTHTLNQDTLKNAYEQLRSNFDNQNGGFGGAIKFPSSHMLSFLLRYWNRSHDPQALAMVEKTLHAMADGGIHDQIGGGFHRYSTDSFWRVPHFEKMLYDQAMLSMTYLEAYQATGKKEYVDVVRDILDYVLRDMTSSEGAFYSAEDADSQDERGQKREGTFYLWTANEISDVLSKEDAVVFDYYFGVEPGGNMRGDFGDKNILYVAHSIEETARQFGKSVEEIQNILQQAKAKLLAQRTQRTRPFRDDKVLTDWNGLMITSFASAAQVLDEPRYAQAAQKAADFLLAKMKRSDGRLMHRWRKGESAIGGFLDDYAFFTQGLLAAYEATFNPQYLQQAKFLVDEMIRLFGDKIAGGFFLRANDEQALIGRTKDAYDGAIPSGNSVAAMILGKLGRLMMEKRYEIQARATVDAFSAQVELYPSGFTYMLAALDYLLGPSREIVIAGDQNDPHTQAMVHEIHQHFMPNKVICLHPVGQQQARAIEALVPFIKDQKLMGGKSTAYVCSHYVCKLPVNDVKKLQPMLK
ncbi:MAG: thioredoxin domain-containing protein [Candidatus Omnitrophica bacterium]|nr:thioredoxin domain-containing protein [Candidatus Omnitrophota bacterium]